MIALLVTNKKENKSNFMEILFYFPFMILTYIFEWIENKEYDDESLEYPDIYIEQEKNLLIEKVIKLSIEKTEPLIVNRFIANPGFTLIELVLVISVGLAMSFLSFQQMVRSQEDIQARAVGEQIKQLGNSVNSYIAVHYDKLSSLSNSDGSTLDPGPRTCIAAAFTCNITIQTLINEGLLPLNYASKNLFDSTYTILFKRSGSVPYYNVAGLITTDNPWRGAGSSVRYDLLGKAMQEAGVDSGMTRDIPSVLGGYKGLWSHNTTEFSNVNKLGQLGFQVGYGSYSYSIYLRRDGTLPMTGNLNMGSQSINNAQDINGAGNLTMAGKGNFGSEVTAKNGYGDSITLGGDAGNNDYELRLGVNKPLVIYSPTSTQYSTVLRVNRNAVIYERLATNGLDPNDLPAGWSGGLRANDIYAVGSIATGSGGNVPAYLNGNGQIYASNSITTSGNMSASGNITVGGNVNTAGETYTGGWFRTRGDTGWYSEKWGGGWHMTDSSWIRAYANKNVYTAGQMRGGTVQSDGRFTAGEYIALNGVGSVGSGCSPNGLIGRTSDGRVISCVNGVWSTPGGGPRLSTYNLENYNNSYNYLNLGAHDVCLSLYGNENNTDDSWRGVQNIGGNNWRITIKNASETAICLDW